MSVDLGAAIERGFDRVTTAEGGRLVAVFVAVAVLVDIAWETVLGRFVRGDPFFDFVPAEVATDYRQAWAGREVLVDVEVPVVSFIALVILLWLVQFVLRIGAKRWFVGDASRELSISMFTRRLGWTLLNLIAGLILYVLAIAIPPVLLLFVGGQLGAYLAFFGGIVSVFLAVALYFYTFEVIIEGENAIEALANSYALTAGTRLRLFLVILVFTLVGALLGGIGVPGVLPGRFIPVVLGATATSAFGVFVIATTADLYRQLVERDDEPEDADPDNGPVKSDEPTAEPGNDATATP